MARRALGRATLSVVQAVEGLPRAGWLVACSGGPDSLALAWAAAIVGRRRGTPVRAVVVDHGLQEGSDAVAAGVLAVLAALPDPVAPPAESLVLPAEVRRVVVTHGAGPEASARDARFAALADAARPGERVLLGHTLDDQAETVLLGLARGSGTRSLAGMPASRGVFDRPLLALGREVTAAACAELGLTPWLDPHNGDPRFARVRVRSTVLPTLERELGPGVREALARTALIARQDADALDALAAAELAAHRAQGAAPATPAAPTAGSAGRTEHGQDAEETSQNRVEEPDDSLGCAWLAGLPPAVRGRVLRAWLAERGVTETMSAHLDALDALVTAWRGQGGVHLPGAVVERRDGRLIVSGGVQDG